MAGFENEIFQVLNYIKKIIRIRKVSVNTVETNILPFNRLKIRLKKEIISIGLKKLNLRNNKYASSKDWNRILSEKNIKIIDVRNQYEIGVGKFKKSIKKRKLFQVNLKILKKLTKLLCTGGIECLQNQKVLKMSQLKGGTNYLKISRKIILMGWRMFRF